MGKSKKSKDSAPGPVKTSQDLTDDSESLEVTVTDFDRCMDPYRTLFSALSANFTLPAVKESSEQMGARTQKQHFAHQTSGLVDIIWDDENEMT